MIQRAIYLILLSLLCLLSGCYTTATDPPDRSPLPHDARLLWFDATANFERLGTHDEIDRLVETARRIGFTDLILDVKPLSGEVLYESAYASGMREYHGHARPDDYDFAGYFIDRTRREGMRAHLAFNIFSEGHNWERRGLVFTDHPEWQTVLYDSIDTLRRTTEAPRREANYAAFTNPAREDVQQHQLNVLREAAEKFRPDGIILDRARYDNLYSDFSDESREMFEAYIGREIEEWPHEIMRRTEDPRNPARGPYFNTWLEWRASVITSFVERARETVKSVHEDILFANYVGAWYPEYYGLGVNWASTEYDPSEEYDWATPEYREYGFPHYFDFLLTGNYFFEVTPQDLEESAHWPRVEKSMGERRDTSYTVESSIRLVDRLVGDETLTIPSLYVEQYIFENDPDQFERALRAALRMQNRVMLFDVVHLEVHDVHNLWKRVDRAFADFPRQERATE